MMPLSLLSSTRFLSACAPQPYLGPYRFRNRWFRTCVMVKTRTRQQRFTAAYDAAIASFLDQVFIGVRPAAVPGALSLQEPLVQNLRYGENPHQTAALYGRFRDYFAQLHGKELSYNNILDLTAAAGLIAEFSADPPTLAILKHTNPCGVGQAGSLREAWD